MITKKQEKALARTRLFLEREIALLKVTRVNDHSDALLEKAAPETFAMLTEYFERRLHEIDRIMAVLINDQKKA